MMPISEKRLEELLDIEAKMQALEAGGVDNWEGYGDSLEPYWAKKKAEQKAEEMIFQIIDRLAEHAYEPSERGAGFAFHDDGIQDALTYIKGLGINWEKVDIDV